MERKAKSQPADQPTSQSTALITAEARVINATILTVTNGILVVTVLHGFKTKQAIKLTITPATSSAIQFLENDGPGDLILAPGLQVPKLAVVVTGIGNLLAYGLAADSVSATGSGIGTIMLNGTFGGGSVTTSGTGTVYLVGNVSGVMQINAGGITSVFVQGTPTAVLQGTVQGLSKVLFTAGTCNVQAQFASLFMNVFGNPCQQVTGPGDLGFDPMWTCGLVVDGFSTCSVPTGGGPQESAAAIPWNLTEVLPPTPPARHITEPPPYGGAKRLPSANNRNVVYSSNNGGTTMTSSSNNGGPAVVTINGQVVSPNGGQDEGLSQNSNGLAVASITCADTSPLGILD
ncbi:MAG: hypothetical protein WDW36_009048 [Sanguina aurantia]